MLRFSVGGLTHEQTHLRDVKAPYDQGGASGSLTQGDLGGVPLTVGVTPSTTPP